MKSVLWMSVGALWLIAGFVLGLAFAEGMEGQEQMSELDSRDVARRVEEHFDYKVPSHNGQVLLHPIVLAVLDILKEEGFIELDHRTDVPSAAVVPSEGEWVPDDSLGIPGYHYNNPAPEGSR